VGETYFLDLGSATFTEPPGVGSLLSQYIADLYLLFHVVDLDQALGTADLFLARADKEGNDYLQVMCEPTTPLGEDASWDNPYLSMGPTEIGIAIEDSLCSLTDVEIAGSFEPDGDAMVGGTFDAFMDTRCLDTLIDPGAEEGAACELLDSLGIPCQPCPDETGDFCLQVSAYGIHAEQVDATATDPETGEEYETLIAVTEEMVEGWVEAGVCS